MSDQVTPDAPLPQPQSPSGTLAGCALFSIGLLILVPSGICTAIGGVGLVIGMVSDPASLARDFEDVLPVAAITLLTLALGIALVWAGLRLRR
jgi:hypothetical protein